MRKRVLVIFMCMLVFVSCSAVFAEAQETQTVKNGIIEENGNSYYYENGVRFVPSTYGVYEKGGNHYYFDSNGAVKIVPAAGLYAIDDVTYYFFADSTIKTTTSNGYKKINGTYYYMKKPYYIDDTKARKVIANGLRFYFGTDGNLLTSTNVTRTTLKRSGKTLELRTAAKQSVGGYDTLQGSCTDGKYGYYVLYNRKVNKCKIVKIRLSDNKVIKTSGVLKIHHGNGLTYNPVNKSLVAVHNTTYPKRLSVISPSTLKVQKTVNVKIPSTLTGATKANLNSIKGFGSISYNEKQGVYIVLLSSSHNLLILDKNFKPIEYRKLSQKPKGVYQCIDTTDNYILIGLSPGSGLSSNVICVYEWDGTYRFMMKVRDGYELESIFHVGKKLYAGFYRSSNNNRRNYVYRLSNYVWEI